MTMPLFICIAGLIVWLISARPGANNWVEAWTAQVGKIAFFCGLLVTLLSVTGKPIW